MMPFFPDKPYNALPLLPPEVDIERVVILKKAVQARAALAELKGMAETIPNPEILINSIILQEAMDSSEIENIITTHDKLYKAFAAKSGQFDSATKEVIRYREALWEGYKLLEKKGGINTNVIVSIYQILKDTTAGVRKVPGTTLQNAATGETLYTPPSGEKLLHQKLDNLWRYMHDRKFSQIEPLIKMAVIHYQFESIHPFTDGNGRTGRIVNILYLVQEKLLDLPILYLSSYIIKQKSEYYRHLRLVTRENAWQPWVLFMLDAVEQTSHETLQKILTIRELMDETLHTIRSALPKIKHAKELTEILFMNPYCKIDYLVEHNIAVRQTASRYLQELEKAGILKAEKVWKERIYLNTRLYDLLSDLSR